MQIRGSLLALLIVGMLLIGLIGCYAYGQSVSTVDRQYTMEELNRD